MKLDDALRGVVSLGLDTAPPIYLVEDHPKYADLVDEVARHITDGHIIGVTSVISLGEVLVQPFARGDLRLIPIPRGHAVIEAPDQERPSHQIRRGQAGLV